MRVYNIVFRFVRYKLRDVDADYVKWFPRCGSFERRSAREGGTRKENIQKFALCARAHTHRASTA